jgi:transcriptional regulator with XRE-family HTH domain
MLKFSTRLKELRNKANLSQQELSKIIGISKSSINMYERGEREPGLETVGALADYFGVRTDYLLGKNDDTRSPQEAKKYNKLIIQSLEDYRQLHGYDRKQIEDLFDWSGMYSDLEKGQVLGDAGLLKTVQSLLAVDQKENSPSEPSLTEGEKMWLELYHRLSDDARKSLIETMSSFDSLPKDTQQLALQLLRVALGGHE